MAREYQQTAVVKTAAAAAKAAVAISASGKLKVTKKVFTHVKFHNSLVRYNNDQ